MQISSSVEGGLACIQFLVLSTRATVARQVGNEPVIASHVSTHVHAVPDVIGGALKTGGGAMRLSQQSGCDANSCGQVDLQSSNRKANDMLDELHSYHVLSRV